ncbi:MAG: PKD domain-containing protein, partial [Nitrososphaerota archaeon]
PGRIATYTGPAVSRYVSVVCGEGRDVRLAYQVPGQGRGDAQGPNGGGGSGNGEVPGEGGGGQSQGPSGGGGSGSGNGGPGGPELRHFSCEVRAIGNKKVVRLYVNIQAVVNQGVKPYNFTVDFGDGTVETSIQEGSAYTTNHIYENGEYTASVIITDAVGRTVSASLDIPGECRNA